MLLNFVGYVEYYVFYEKIIDISYVILPPKKYISMK